MLRPLAALALLLALAGCDSSTSEEQRAFNDQAFFGAASGITRVTASGQTTSVDADDWRVGPAFGTAVLSVFFDGPNPVRIEDNAYITLNLSRGLSRPLYLYVVRGGNQDFTWVQQIPPPDISGPGFPSYRVSGSELSATGGPGIFRVVLVDDRHNVVTYGDIEVSG